MYMIGQTISSLPIDLNNINYIKIENGIYDDVYATHVNTNIKAVNEYVVPEEWDEETYLHAKFNGDLFSGNTNFGVENTTNIIVKRREKGSYKWFPLFNIEADSSEDFNFVIIDPYAASGVTYEYAVVPIINGVEGEYSITECKVSFDNLVIIDKDETFTTMLDVEYSQQKNNTTSSVLPIESRYPIYVTNASNDYYTGNISATFIEIINGELVLDNTTKYREKVLDFLNNRKVKYIKEPNGKCWIASIGTTISEESKGHPDVRTISFDFTEVGDIESNEDMKRFGLLDIGEEWWI